MLPAASTLGMTVDVRSIVATSIKSLLRGLRENDASAVAETAVAISTLFSGSSADEPFDVWWENNVLHILPELTEASREMAFTGAAIIVALVANNSAKAAVIRAFVQDEPLQRLVVDHVECTVSLAPDNADLSVTPPTQLNRLPAASPLSSSSSQQWVPQSNPQEQRNYAAPSFPARREPPPSSSFSGTRPPPVSRMTWVYPPELLARIQQGNRVSSVSVPAPIASTAPAPAPAPPTPAPAPAPTPALALALASAPAPADISPRTPVPFSFASKSPHIVSPSYRNAATKETSELEATEETAESARRVIDRKMALLQTMRSSVAPPGTAVPLPGTAVPSSVPQVDDDAMEVDTPLTGLNPDFGNQGGGHLDDEADAEFRQVKGHRKRKHPSGSDGQN